MLCRNCEKEFTPRREWQLFCSDKCKKIFNRVFRETCFYCGVSGNHRDHLHPVNIRGSIRTFKGQEFVPACRECNVTLSDLYFEDITKRLQHLIDEYEVKYANILKAKPWDEEEVAELGPMLKAVIKSSLAQRRDIEERLKYLFSVKHKLLCLMEKEEELV